jgi:methyl-accepting chemotaxis protein
MTERNLEKYTKRLVGRTDMEDALMRLDRLTQEEARMAVAQNLMATHTVDERVREVANTVVAIDNRVVSVDDRVAGVDERVARVDDRVASVNDKLKGIDARLASIDDRVKVIDDKVIHGAQVIFS